MTRPPFPREEKKIYKASFLYIAKIEGEEIGEKRGEKREKIKIAKTSLQQNIDISTISLITGLSVEEIEELKNESSPLC